MTPTARPAQARISRDLAAIVRAAQAWNAEALEARKAEEQHAQTVREADEMGIPDDPSAAEFLRKPDLDLDPGDFGDLPWYAARTFHREAKERRARAEARAEDAEAAYYAFLDRRAERRPLRLVGRQVTRSPRRVPRRRSHARRARVAAVASAGDGPPPSEPPAPTRTREHAAANGGAS